MTGRGFARRITLSNLHLFCPLLGNEKVPEESSDAGFPDRSHEKTPINPEIAQAEALFQGAPIRTGVRFKYAKTHKQNRSSRGVREERAERATLPDRPEVLLMRVRPRRNGTQLQVSMIVHTSFMKGASRIVSASNGKDRTIGFDYIRRGDNKVKNLARFEAPELEGKKEPIARFTWVADEHDQNKKVLQYEILDGKDPQGKSVLEYLESGMGTKPNTNLANLSSTETVLSKPDRRRAQWYRLE